MTGSWTVNIPTLSQSCVKTEDRHLLAELGTAISDTKEAIALMVTSSQCCHSKALQQQQLAL